VSPAGGRVVPPGDDHVGTIHPQGTTRAAREAGPIANPEGARRKTMRDDPTSGAERAEQVALFRYGLISDLLLRLHAS
jgi:hypothetical protein